MVVAAVGLAASILIHGCSFLGMRYEGQLTELLVLCVAILVVLLPLIVALDRIRVARRGEVARYVSTNCPDWLRALFATFFVYAIFNFLFTTQYLMEGGVPSRIDGQEVLHNHGRVIRTLGAEEFETMEAYRVRACSGHWMAFYSFYLMILVGWVPVGNQCDLENKEPAG